MAKAKASISIVGTDLVVDLQGMDKLWSLKSQLTIPLVHVRGARVDPEIARRPVGWRAPGTYFPGVITAGTYRKDDQRVFWDVHDKDKTVVIDLADDNYARLVIEVADPAATTDLITRAISHP